MRFVTFTAIALLGTAVTSPAVADVLVDEDFDDNTANGFVADAAFTAANQQYEYRRSTSNGDRLFETSLTAVTNRVAGTDFTITVNFTLNSASDFSGVEELLESGLLILSDSTGDSAYGVGFRPLEAIGETDGNQLFVAKGDFNNPKSSDPDQGTFPAYDESAFTAVIGTEYTLTVTGTYAGSDLTIAADVSDVGGSIATASITDSSGTPLAGDDFGFFGRAKRVNGSVDFDNYLLEGTLVPEPASLVMVGLGSLLILGRGRRRNA